MSPHLNIGGQYSELAISAINLNADTHRTQGKSSPPFSYYRLFYLGKPVSEFYCKACQNGLGAVAPDRCERCRPFVVVGGGENMGSVERVVVGFSQVADGIAMGEYSISVRF